MSAPLAGVRVLDLSRVLAGPWASQLLADLGAEVIKVERPQGGDDTRAWGPPWAENPETGAREAAYFLSTNRGKRSIAVDLASPEGQAVVRDLATRSDVVIENFKVGALARYGLDSASLRALNRRLVYCSITGFGQTGPYATRPGYDLLIQGMGGLMSITGLPDGVPGGGPMKVGVALVDILTGLHAANGIQAALRRRDKTGEGAHLDVALLDCLTAALANQALNTLVTGESQQRLGNAHPSIAPYDVFATADGHIILAVGNDGQFAALCGILERPEWAEDPRFTTNSARVASRAALTPLIEARLAGRSSRAWFDLFAGSGVPAGPINRIGDVFDDPQVRHRGLALDLIHDSLGRAPGVDCPIRFSGEAAPVRRAPPVLGEATQEVLRDRLLYAAEKIEELFARGVVTGSSA